jgi:hypothetical protein
MDGGCALSPRRYANAIVPIGAFGTPVFARGSAVRRSVAPALAVVGLGREDPLSAELSSYPIDHISFPQLAMRNIVSSSR